jgi:hypothetical protein
MSAMLVMHFGGCRLANLIVAEGALSERLIEIAGSAKSVSIRRSSLPLLEYSF